VPATPSGTYHAQKSAVGNVDRPARILEPHAAAGYQVIFVPKDGNPQDALTDFLNDKGEAQGRPEASASTRRTPGGRRRRRCDLARQPGDAFNGEATPRLQARSRAVRLFPSAR
jgi:hypothetical protein